MLAGFFIFFQILALAAFILFYYRKDIFWGASSLVLTGMLGVASFAIRIPEYQWDASINAYQTIQQVYSQPYLAGFNIGLFCLTLMYLIYVVVVEYRNPGKEPIVGPEVK